MDSVPHNRQLLFSSIFVIALIILVIGIAHLAFGMLWTIDRQEIKFDTDNGFMSLGVSIFIAGQLVCMGIAIHKKHFILACVAFFCLIGALMIDLGILIYSVKKFVAILDRNNYREEVIKQTYIQSSQNSESSRSEVDIWQSMRKCCGYNGSSDPEVVEDSESGLLLETCCPFYVKRCTSADAFPEACTFKLINALNYSSIVMIALSASSLPVLIICLILFTPFMIDYYKNWSS